MKKILVPVDFSPLSANAGLAAQKLAQRMGAELHLIHIIHSPTMLDETGYEVTQTEEREAQADMTEFVRRYGIKPDRMFTKLGELTEDLNYYIKNYGIDLVVMATKGASGFRELFVGSNAEKIVRTAPVPVLSVKGTTNELDFSSVAIAGSFDREPPSNITTLLEIRKAYNASVHLIEVCVPENMWRKEIILRSMEEFANAHGLDHVKYHILEDFSVVQGIEKFAKNHYIDLLAMATHQRQGFNRFFRSSIAESLVNHLPDAVLTFKLETEDAAQ